MKTKIFVCVLALVFAMFTLAACSTNNTELLEQIEQLEAQLEELRAATPDELRVFYNGNSDVWLFPDGTFILNYFHHTKISGTYEEMPNPDGDDIAIVFTHNGRSLYGSSHAHDHSHGHNHSHGHDHAHEPVHGASFAPSSDGVVTVVGGIDGNYLTLPEEWEDDHGHGSHYRLRETLVFSGPNGNRITLNTDRSFVAEFNDGIMILGYYMVRAFALDHNPSEGEPMPYVHNAITFIPGMPTFSADGDLQGAVFAVPITEGGTTLTIPGPWVEIAGAEAFTLEGMG